MRSTFPPYFTSGETIACISTRVAAAIHLKPVGCRQIDSERINELFAVSLPELTLAWLNL